MDCCGHGGPGNTAIMESDDGAVIVDTHSKPPAARVIVERLREITAKPVRYVVTPTSPGTTGTATKYTPPPPRGPRP